MQEYLNQLDPNVIYIKHEIINNTMHIYCEKKRIIGPYVNSKKIRIIQDINYGNYKVLLHITTRKYFPSKDNEHYISDKLDFLNYSKRRTQRLDDLCLNIVANQSYIGAQRTLKNGIADVSDSTIAYIVSKKKQVINYEKIQYIAIDDFAKRKRFSYYSVIIDHDTRKITDLIDSRLKNNIVEILKKYINVKLVTRDRSSCFKEAINEAIPNALHLVDKFHLTKELAEHCEYELKKILENSILFFNPEDKLLVSGKKVRQNKSDLNEFHSIILEKVKNGLSCPCILKFLNEEYGYEGNVTAVQDYVRYLKNNEIQGNLIVIQRKKLVQLFYNKSIEEIFVDETQRACVEKLLSLNKKLSELVSLSTYFHQILYENKSKNELKNLIDINQKIEYQTERLIRFINGIDRDYDYLSNSLAYNFSNGLAEGKINLIKTIKRTMFGRCSFKTLANKIFLFQFMPN